MRTNRIGSLKGRSRIFYETVDGTAKANVDYKPLSGDLVFEPGELQKHVKISLLWRKTTKRSALRQPKEKEKKRAMVMSSESLFLAE